MPRDRDREVEVPFVVFSVPGWGGVAAVVGLAVVCAITACVVVSCVFGDRTAQDYPPITHGSCEPFCAAIDSAVPSTPGGAR